MTAASGQLVRTVALTKVYSDGTLALKGVDFTVQAGEIHGLLGENGAGKTTLSRILSGILKRSSGEVYLKGQKVDFRRPREALALGVGMVHQHFSLVRPFTAFENIVLGTQVNPKGAGAKNARDEIGALADDVGLQVSLDTPIEEMALGAQQRVEILKMLYRKVDVLILDEPTSSLTLVETQELFKALRKLKGEGKCVIFITHKLREVMDICDVITVLRHGQVTGIVSKGDATPRGLARMMVGRDVEFELQRAPTEVKEPVLQVEDLHLKDKDGREVLKGINLQVRRGEIVGLAGVEGNGQTELAEAIGGIRASTQGRILVKGADITRESSSKVRKQGVGLIPEDRRQAGLILEMNLSENVILGKQRERQFKGPMVAIAWRKVRDFTAALMKKFEITAQGPEALAKSLSGGNQQKVVVSRELSSDPDFILAAQPTRGLDVAATEYIRGLLLAARSSGKGVLLISADLDEVMQLSDVIGVMYSGEIIEMAPSSAMNREKIGLLMGGVKE